MNGKIGRKKKHFASVGISDWRGLMIFRQALALTSESSDAAAAAAAFFIHSKHF